MKKIVSIEDLSLSYETEAGEVKALENICMYAREGEFLSVIGPSGCGKSSLLSCVAGLIAPTGGKIEIFTERGREDLGYMFQRDCLFPWRTIEKNILLGLEVKKKLTEENISYAQGLLKTYGLWDFRNSYPSQLSGGMRQRASLIRTLAVKPRVLLLDEPFSALDYQTRLSVNDDIYRIIKNEGKTALMVTHDISEAVSMSDRVIVLTKRPGKVKSIYKTDFGKERGSPLKCREKEKFKDYFNEIWRDIDAPL